MEVQQLSDSTFHFDADSDPTQYSNAEDPIRILLLIKVMRTYDHWFTDPP
jgi:hypothetical protein